MNRKQVLGIVALSLSAAVASAQTVPAEQWVGPPITFTSTQSRAAVTAAYVAAGPATAPQELRVGPADAGPGAVSRVEVAADRNLWMRAGLGLTNDYDGMSGNPGYAQRMANYTRMRNGPEYMAEVNRIESGRSSKTAMSSFFKPAQ
ncbi:hypothetical protein QTI66_24880 [Variovorax sp. J22R133]|uniref:hypothetical protein n=1 Tax=Variovorax brevis TaxID=3053503 RepID=UPI00257734DB|nr:hypothetical protein [Variovorax sp. J22R133]MDM0115408.1 hypothetical protein [Variovorax sp. J22R133]